MYPDSITLHTSKVTKFSTTVAQLDFEAFCNDPRIAETT